MPERELVARCVDCDKLFTNTLKWDNENIDHRSELVIEIGSHHLEFKRGDGHNKFVIFMNNNLANVPPDNQQPDVSPVIKFPLSIGFIAVGRTRDPDVFNVAGQVKPYIK